MKILACLVLLLLSSTGWGVSQPKVTGIFSNLHYIEEAGDVLGVEISIIYSTSGYFAFIQCAEGAPSKPVLVVAKVNGNHIQLASHDDPASHCPKASFSGKDTATGLQGTFDGTTYPGFLKRRKGYWQ